MLVRPVMKRNFCLKAKSGLIVNTLDKLCFFFAVLCIIYRYVARATKKRRGYDTKKTPLQDYTTVSYAPTTMIAHTAKQQNSHEIVEDLPDIHC